MLIKPLDGCQCGVLGGALLIGIMLSSALGSPASYSAYSTTIYSLLPLPPIIPSWPPVPCPSSHCPPTVPSLPPHPIHPAHLVPQQHYVVVGGGWILLCLALQGFSQGCHVEPEVFGLRVALRGVTAETQNDHSHTQKKPSRGPQHPTYPKGFLKMLIFWVTLGPAKCGWWRSTGQQESEVRRWGGT